MSSRKGILIVLSLMASGIEFAEAERRTITAEPGHDVTLPCRAGDGRNITAVHWSRPDLGSGYVLLYRDGHLDPSYQHPSFQQRVDLQDRQMKDGDVSLILKKVTTDDTGTYECRVFQGRNRRKRGIFDSDPTCIIHLEVSPAARMMEDGGDEDGRNKDGGDEVGRNKDGGDEVGRKKDGGNSNGSLVLPVSVIVFFVVLFIGGGFMFYKRWQKSIDQQQQQQQQQQVEISVISGSEHQSSECPSISCPY